MCHRRAQRTYTHGLGALGGAVSAQVEGVLLWRRSHDGGVNQAQLHDGGIVAPQTGRVMEPNPR